MTAATAAASYAASGDCRFMDAALALGRRELGRTWPNPAVGAVVVHEGRDGPVIVGRGWTQAGGRPHAETEALRRAGDAARGATLYVSLEPCSHHGKTPPCADAIIAAGVRRVVSAMDDPNPDVAGRGHARLRAAGIVVEVGLGRCRGPPRPRRPYPPHARRPAARHPEACHIGRRQGRSRRPAAGCHHRPGGAGAGAHAAGAERCLADRHRHRACRRSATDLPSARYGRPLAGADRARYAPAASSR